MKSKGARENAAPADKRLCRFVTAPINETTASPVHSWAHVSSWTNPYKWERAENIKNKKAAWSCVVDLFSTGGSRQCEQMEQHTGSLAAQEWCNPELRYATYTSLRNAILRSTTNTGAGTARPGSTIGGCQHSIMQSLCFYAGHASKHKNNGQADKLYGVTYGLLPDQS